MSDWKKRPREIEIPGMNKLNKIKCTVCGNEFVPTKKKGTVQGKMIRKAVCTELYQATLNRVYMTVLIVRYAAAKLQ